MQDVSGRTATRSTTARTQACRYWWNRERRAPSRPPPPASPRPRFRSRTSLPACFCFPNGSPSDPPCSTCQNDPPRHTPEVSLTTAVHPPQSQSVAVHCEVGYRMNLIWLIHGVTQSDDFNTPSGHVGWQRRGGAREAVHATTPTCLTKARRRIRPAAPVRDDESMHSQDPMLASPSRQTPQGVRAVGPGRRPSLLRLHEQLADTCRAID